MAMTSMTSVIPSLHSPVMYFTEVSARVNCSKYRDNVAAWSSSLVDQGAQITLTLNTLS